MWTSLILLHNNFSGIQVNRCGDVATIEAERLTSLALLHNNVTGIQAKRWKC